jgi:signal transduction histidine kinase
MAIFERRSSVSALLIGLLLTLVGTLLILLVEEGLNPHLPNDSWRTVANLAAVATFAFSISPLRRSFNYFIESRFFRGELADQAALRQLSERLLQSTDLLSVITASVSTISQRFNIPFAVCYIIQKDEHHLLTVKQIVPWHYPSPELPPLDQKGAILEFLSTERQPIAFSTLQAELNQEEAQLRNNEVSQDAKVRRDFVAAHTAKRALYDVMKILNVELVVPLMTKDQLFGVIFLAAVPEKRPFNIDELSFIDVATAETITSIQRANYFEGDIQKTEFISIASHELRTPLTAIRGYLSMILDEHITGSELDGESTNQLQKIYHLTQQLISMVNDLLTLSRLESGRTKIEPQQVDLIEVSKKIVEKYRVEAEKKKIEITITETRNLPHAWADPSGVELVVSNLISNAIVYNRSGGKVTVTVHSHPTAKVLAIDVQDTGIGMTKEQMSHLYERFYRVEAQETEGISGTGLGLNITHSYIQRMNGSISVKSEPEKGTTFTVLFPLFNEEQLRKEAEAATAEAEAAGVEVRSAVPIGLLLLSAKRSGELYSAADLALLEAVGHQAIITIQRAKLYEGDQMKTQFVSIASHELLTPISAIEGYITLVLQQHKEDMAPKTAEFLGNVNSAIHRLSTLVRDLLSVSRLESGRITMTPQSFDISKSIRETLAQLEFVAKERGITLTLDPLPENLPQAYADPERTTQVLMNLVGNAIKYNRPDGRVTIEVSAGKGDGMIKVGVTDTGIGMNKEHMSHLFEKFYRVASSETVGIVGTGLGLYITKSIVERMGGQISVKSMPGKGSTFSFALPTTKEKAGATTPDPSAPPVVSQPTLEPVEAPAPAAAHA